MNKEDLYKLCIFTKILAEEANKTLPPVVSFYKNSLIKKPVLTLLLTSSILFANNWWLQSGGAANYKEMFLGEKPDGIKVELADSSLQKLAPLFHKIYQVEAWIYPVDLTKSVQEGLKLIPKNDRDFIANRMDNFIVLDYIVDDTTGLKAAFIKDTTTNEHVLTIMGTSLASKRDFIIDYPSAFESSAGGLTPQFPKLHEFAVNCSNKYSNNFTIVGHSLGAHLGMCLAPEFPHNNVIAFDAPAYSTNLLAKLSNYYEVPENKLKIKLINTYNIITHSNTYNTMGIAAHNISLTNPKKDEYNKFSLTNPLKGHIHSFKLYNNVIANKNFTSGLVEWGKSSQKLFQADTSRDSAAGLIVTSGLLLLCLTTFAIERGAKNLYRKLTEKPNNTILAEQTTPANQNVSERT